MIIRFFDIFLSILALSILSPLLLIIISILKCTGENKVFYLQNRIGRSRNPFRVVKFATMLEASPNIGAGTITVSDDPRVLPFGKFLRATKINEIPQLINVILGEMTLIGPRPLTSREFNIYSLQGQQIISSVLPGLSGLGSVALRNETRFLHIENDPHQSYASFIVPYREKLEIWFVENRSVLLYQKLIIATILVVIFPNLNILNKLNLQIPFLEESNSEQD